MKPEHLPILRVDDHLDRVDDAALQLNALRQRFKCPPVWSPELRGGESKALAPAAAAVLIPLVQRDDHLVVVVTLRPAHLGIHPAQVSFPGGKTEPSDAGAIATALREAQEEIGLTPDQVEVLGEMPVYTTASGFAVTPVVAAVNPEARWTPNPAEVDEVFEIPLWFFMNPAHHRWHRVDKDHAILSMSWHSEDASCASRQCLVWGATAAMLRNLYGFLRA